MTGAQLLILGLVLTPIINWPVFGVLFVTARRNPGIRSLIHLRWLSLGIAVMSTAWTLLILAALANVTPSAEVVTLGLTLPVYAVTAVNLVFLYITGSGRW